MVSFPFLILHVFLILFFLYSFFSKKDWVNNLRLQYIFIWALLPTEYLKTAVEDPIVLLPIFVLLRGCMIWTCMGRLVKQLPPDVGGKDDSDFSDSDGGDSDGEGPFEV